MSRYIPVGVRRRAADARRCFYCESARGPFEMDHVVAIANGGTAEPGNIVLACRACNRAKGTRPPFHSVSDAIRSHMPALQRKHRTVQILTARSERRVVEDAAEIAACQGEEAVLFSIVMAQIERRIAS